MLILDLRELFAPRAARWRLSSSPTRSDSDENAFWSCTPKPSRTLRVERNDANVFAASISRPGPALEPPGEQAQEVKHELGARGHQPLRRCDGMRTTSLSRNATTVAERGSPVSSDISPTSSPGPICAIIRVPIPASTKTPKRPVTTM